ncbi:hypothetical protein [Pseudokineococcus sp. 1T1Z-3]|uniref:hypothetical protein n=1 Tax=Pseudokineococcus sp. 1T1Z-3 TaxID=3132745 RepID=UPI00309D6B37
MRTRPLALTASLALVVVLPGCAGEAGLLGSRDAAGAALEDGRLDGGGDIPMTTYRERVAAEEAREARDDAARQAQEGLAGCADPGDAQSFEVSAAGVDVELQVPVDADEDPVEQLEEYRQDVGAGPVCWVLAEVDARDGAEVVDLPLVEVTTADGRTVALQRAADVLAGWGDLVLPDESDLAARGVELITTTGGVVGPGERGEVVLVATVDLDDARAVRVQVTDGGPLVAAS